MTRPQTSVPPLAPMTAAIYIRVSTDKQAEHGYSLPTQLDACTQYARQYAFIVPPSYIFVEDETGTILDRPGLRDLRDIIVSRLIQAVIVYRLDRLGRNLGNQLFLINEWKASGVQVFDTTSAPQAPSPERTLLQQIQGVIAEYEHAQILERTERGRRGRAQAGIPFPQAPFGYHYVADGPKTGYYEIAPAEAAIVLQIFHWYVTDGLVLRAIARRLRQQQVPTPQQWRKVQGATTAPRFWQNSTLYNILTNRDYLGTQYYGKRMNLVGTQGRKKTRHAHTDPVTWTPITIPALVPPDLFEAVAHRMAANVAHNPRRRTREYLLSGGRLRCDVCGHRMTGFMHHNTRPAYRCLHSYDGERRRWCRWILDVRVAPQVWEAVCQLVRHPQQLSLLLDTYRQTVGPAQVQQERLRAQQALQHARQALERLVDLYLQAEVSRDLYNKRRLDLERDAAVYQTQLTALDAQEHAMAAAATERSALADVLDAVNALLDEATTIPARQRILDMLGVTVYYTPERQFRFEVMLPSPRPPASEGVLSSSTLQRAGTKDTALPRRLTWILAA